MLKNNTHNHHKIRGIKYTALETLNSGGGGGGGGAHSIFNWSGCAAGG